VNEQACQRTHGRGRHDQDDVEDLDGTNYSDKLYGNDAANLLVGHDRADTLVGNGGPTRSRATRAPTRSRVATARTRWTPRATPFRISRTAASAPTSPTPTRSMPSTRTARRSTRS